MICLLQELVSLSPGAYHNLITINLVTLVTVLKVGLSKLAQKPKKLENLGYNMGPP